MLSYSVILQDIKNVIKDKKFSCYRIIISTALQLLVLCLRTNIWEFIAFCTAKVVGLSYCGGNANICNDSVAD